MLDVLIRNGWVADGTGNPMYPADVAIQGDKVVDVTRLPGAQAARVIDAKGKIVAPGFIDAHSHSDWSIHANPTGESTTRQGVTTEIVGQCGLSSAPVTDASRAMVTGRLRTYAYDGEVTWTTFAQYLDAIAKMGTSYNLAYFVGHNTVRQAAGRVRSRGHRGPAADDGRVRGGGDRGGRRRPDHGSGVRARVEWPRRRRSSG